MKYSIFVLTILLIAFTGCIDKEKKREETSNKQTDSVNTAGNLVRSESPDASTEVEQGYALPKFDDGMAQSPVNILSSRTEKDSLNTVITEFNDEIISIENLGHTIQLNFAEGSSAIVEGKVYQFKQLHFHTPSEHLIDGMTYPMEMHVVTVSEAKKDSGSLRYVVLGILFKMGRENKFIEEFLNAVPKEENKKENLRPGTVKLKDLLTGVSKDQFKSSYHYKGSLTTPPYSESVDWLIKKYIFEASPEQIAAIEKIEGDNARHVRALRDRKVGTN